MAKKDHKEDLMDWQDLWDAACQKGIFPEAPKLDPLPADYDDAAGDYYNNIDREAAEAGLLREETGENDSANPVFPDSVGKDSCVHKTPWVDEDAVEAVAELKRKLYDVECKLNAKDAGGSKWHEKPVEVEDKALWKQIESMREKIDKLSNGLGLKDEPKTSLYRTK